MVVAVTTGADLTFNVELSPSLFPCQGCFQKIVYRYSYPTEREQQIVWSMTPPGSGAQPITLLIVQRQNNGDLTIDTNTPSPRPVEWDVNDPGSITITDILANDTGTYQCQVYLYSGNNIKGSVAMDTSNGLGKDVVLQKCVG